MINVRVVLSALAITLCGTVDGASAKTPIVKATIDYTKPDSVAEQIGDLSGGLSEAGPVVYLDITIKPTVENDIADYRITAISKQGEPIGLDCSAGHRRLSLDFDRFSFSFNPDYNHLLLNVNFAAGEESAFLQVACEYTAADTEANLLTIRGYFAVNIVSIPTAYDIELRPVTPRFDP